MKTICIIILLMTLFFNINTNVCYGCFNCLYYGLTAIACLQCLPDHFFSLNGLCRCNSSSYDFNQICYSCPFPCQTCDILSPTSNKTYCTSCPSNSHRVANSNNCACQTGYTQVNRTQCAIQANNSSQSSILELVGSIVGSVVSFVVCTLIIACLCYFRKKNAYQIHDRNRRNRRNQQIQQSSIHQNQGQLSEAQQTQSAFQKQKVYQYKSEETCSICLDQKTTLMTDCGHYFHPKCIKSWFKKSKNCPNCNKQTDKKKLLKWCKKCFRNTLLASDPSQNCQGCQNCDDVIIIN